MPAIRNNGLALFFGAIFLATLVGQAFVGQDDFNHSQVAHHNDPVSLTRYLTSSEFWVDVLENWQSEYLQFTLFVVATVWLLQRGVARVQGTRQGRHRIRPRAAHRSPRRRAFAAVGADRWMAHAPVFQLAAAGDGGHLIASWLAQSVTGRIASTRSSSTTTRPQ